ncbi:hypothetical protein [Leisingera sp. M658]|uniref:hypothetical protein n=1 Tax=Leisingera sp. M658 TaxID=2867015 RepID=UPI002882D98C|nr:hypothetical protein [Leisingera sp. M658]
MPGRRAHDGIREGFQAAIRPGTPVAMEALEIDDPAKMPAEVKRIAKFFGAGHCGITDLDERWINTARVDTRDDTKRRSRPALAPAAPRSVGPGSPAG